MVKILRVGGAPSLTARERQVLNFLVRGDSNKEIAGCLGCTPRTAAFHVSNILRKTGQASRQRLIASTAEQPHKVTSGTPDGVAQDAGAEPRTLGSEGKTLMFGAVRIDLLTHRVNIDGSAVDLTRAQALALLRLILTPGTPVECADLCRQLGALSPGAVHKQIARLRARLSGFGYSVYCVTRGNARAYVLLSSRSADTPGSHPSRSEKLENERCEPRLPHNVAV
jgi:DNA-binding CsgD family transcriptional regulator